MSELVAVVLDAPDHWMHTTAEAIRAAGCRVGVVSTRAIAEMATLNGLIDELAPVENPLDPDQVAEAAGRLTESYRSSALLTASEPALAPVAVAADRLGLRGTPVEGLPMWRDKYAVRKAIRSAGLPGPRFDLMHSQADAERLATEVGLPVVLKPVTGTGSHLVQVAHTAGELADAYRSAADRLLDSAVLRHLYADRPESRSGSASERIDPTRAFLVEGLLLGPEYCVNLFVRDGIVEQLPLIHKPFLDDKFFELGLVSPPIDLTPEARQRIRTAIDAAVTALRLNDTVAHIELIDDERLGPAVIEVNARPGGGTVSPLYQLTTGVNTFAEQVAIARGAPSPRESAKLPIPLAAFQLYPAQAGRLRAVHGLDALAEHPDVISVWSRVEPGARMTNDHETAVAGFVVAGFTDAADLADTYQDAAALVRIDVDPAPETADLVRSKIDP